MGEHVAVHENGFRGREGIEKTVKGAGEGADPGASGFDLDGYGAVGFGIDKIHLRFAFGAPIMDLIQQFHVFQHLGEDHVLDHTAGVGAPGDGGDVFLRQVLDAQVDEEDLVGVFHLVALVGGEGGEGGGDECVPQNVQITLHCVAGGRQGAAQLGDVLLGIVQALEKQAGIFEAVNLVYEEIDPAVLHRRLELVEELLGIVKWSVVGDHIQVDIPDVLRRDAGAVQVVDEKHQQRGFAALPGAVDDLDLSY